VEGGNPRSGDNVDNDVAYKTLMEKFTYGGANLQVYTLTRRTGDILIVSNMPMRQVAESLVAAGRKDSARKVLEHYDQNVLESNFPYGMASNQNNLHDYFSFRFLNVCYTAEDFTLAKKVNASLKKDLAQQMRYYKSLGG